MMKADPDRPRRLWKKESACSSPGNIGQKRSNMAIWLRRRPIQSKDAIFKSSSTDSRRSRIMSNGSRIIVKAALAVQSSSGQTTSPSRTKKSTSCDASALRLSWNTLPTKLQRELFDNAGSMGELLETAALRGQIARFLHRHKNDENTAAVAAIRPETVHDDADLHAASIARWDDEGGACRMPEQPMPKGQNTDAARG